MPQIAKKRLVRPLEIKALDEKGMFKGYGSVFGNTDSYQDVVVQGAFKSDLQNKPPEKVKMLWQHNTTQPIGVYHSIVEKPYALEVEGQLLIDDVQQAREAYALLKAGAIDGLSIGYSVENSHIGDDGKTYLTDLKLWEISIVTFPANDLALIHDVKSMTVKEFENFLRDAGGLSRKHAKKIISQGFKPNILCDAEADVKVHEEENQSELLLKLNQLSQMIKEFSL